MKDDKSIPITVINRLPRYYRYLTALQQMGISRVSSGDLSRVMMLTPSQIRQDFFNFGGAGLQGYGYDVELLRKQIISVLGIDKTRTMIIIGAGSLGHALAKNPNFEKKGFKVVGMFDVSPERIGDKIRNIEVLHIDTLPAFIEHHTVDIAVMTVPSQYGREVGDLVISLGIKGIWNFTSAELDIPEDVAVENIQLSDSLMVLGYKLGAKKKDK